MATLEIHSARVRLSKTEQAALERSMTDVVRVDSKQRTAELKASFQRRSQFRDVLEAELEPTNLNVARLRQSTVRQFARSDASLAAQVRKSKGMKLGRPSRRPHAVWGLTSGVETPPYDFSWATHDIEGAPAAGNFRHTADANTGALDVYAHGHDSSPKMVDSFAGVGFWYIPNRNGVLMISIAPALHELMWTGALWNDVAAAGGWISLGIASYLREPFGFVDWRTIRTDELYWNVDNWFDWTDHTRDRTAYAMTVSTVVDTAHYYACWAWIRAYVYAENGGSYAGSSVQAGVRSFSYLLL